MIRSLIKRVVIGCDTRNNSEYCAKAAANVFSNIEEGFIFSAVLFLLYSLIFLLLRLMMRLLV